jgi:hypothetical protein
MTKIDETVDAKGVLALGFVGEVSRIGPLRTAAVDARTTTSPHAIRTPHSSR